jgi:hypothetical protein
LPRRRLATVISPFAAVSAFSVLLCWYAWLAGADPASAIAYTLLYSVVIGLPFTYGLVAVFLYPPFRVMAADRTLTPRTVYSASALTGALGAISLWIFDRPIHWTFIGMVGLFGGIAGVIGGLLFVHVGGPFEVRRRPR